MNEMLSRGEMRPRVGQFRNLVFTAAKKTDGDIMELSNMVARELAEVWLVPRVGDSFPILPLLQAGGFEEITSHCQGNAFLKERILQGLNLFLTLAPCDVEWHFQVKRVHYGYVIAAIVGHPKAMLVVREHGLIDFVRENQHVVRQFAFGHTGNKK